MYNRNDKLYEVIYEISAIFEDFRKLENLNNLLGFVPNLKSPYMFNVNNIIHSTKTSRKNNCGNDIQLLKSLYDKNET